MQSTGVSYFGNPLMHPARSFVINPDSIVSMHTASSDWANFFNSSLPSNLPLCSSPRVHANIDAWEKKKENSHNMQKALIVSHFNDTGLFNITQHHSIHVLWCHLCNIAFTVFFLTCALCAYYSRTPIQRTPGGLGPNVHSSEVVLS